MKKYQITANVLIAADGWVKAVNQKEAEKTGRQFCFSEMQGLDVSDVKVFEIITPISKYYDKNNIPEDEEFEESINGKCITHNYLN